MTKREVKQWITVNGAHIPIFDNQNKNEVIKNYINHDEKQKDKQILDNKNQADMRNTNNNYFKKHAEVVKQLSNNKYENGTYDCDNLTVKEFDSGYQVTFCQIGDDYSELEYNTLVGIMNKQSSDGKSYAGKFEGTPEISWHFDNKEAAIKIARQYNQISIWDWGACDEIKTGGTGRRK